MVESVSMVFFLVLFAYAVFVLAGGSRRRPHCLHVEVNEEYWMAQLTCDVLFMILL